MRTRTPVPALDLRDLPDVCFGPRDIMWWGTFGFVIIEGWTIVLCGVAFVYLQQNGSAWPPLGTPLPSLGWPSIELGLMLASLPLVRWCDRAVRRYDLGTARVAFTIAGVYGAVLTGVHVMVLLRALNVKWDTNAYGSAQWLVLTYFGSLVLVEACEVLGLALAYWFAPIEDRHFPDGSDAMFYWRFMVAAFIPVYGLCMLAPRWM